MMIPVLASFALSAVVASSASAKDEWFVNGTLLTTTAALASTAKVDSFAKLKIKAGTETIEVECTGSVLKGENVYIGAPNEGMSNKLEFEKCSTIKPATKCILTGQPVSIKTEPIKATVILGLVFPTDTVNFVPLTGKLFANLKFDESNSCALSAEEPIKGSVNVNAPTGQKEESLQAIEGFGEEMNNSLEVAGNKAFIEGGRALLQLTSGLKWSFH